MTAPSTNNRKVRTTRATTWFKQSEWEADRCRKFQQNSYQLPYVIHMICLQLCQVTCLQYCFCFPSASCRENIGMNLNIFSPRGFKKGPRIFIHVHSYFQSVILSLGQYIALAFRFIFFLGKSCYYFTSFFKSICVLPVAAYSFLSQYMSALLHILDNNFVISFIEILYCHSMPQRWYQVRRLSKFTFRNYSKLPAI